MKYEQIAIIIVAKIGFNTNLLNGNFNLKAFFKQTIDIENATT